MESFDSLPPEFLYIEEKKRLRQLAIIKAEEEERAAKRLKLTQGTRRSERLRQIKLKTEVSIQQEPQDDQHEPQASTSASSSNEASQQPSEPKKEPVPEVKPPWFHRLAKKKPPPRVILRLNPPDENDDDDDDDYYTDSEAVENITPAAPKAIIRNWRNSLCQGCVIFSETSDDESNLMLNLNPETSPLEETTTPTVQNHPIVYRSDESYQLHEARLQRFVRNKMRQRDLELSGEPYCPVNLRNVSARIDNTAAIEKYYREKKNWLDELTKARKEELLRQEPGPPKHRNLDFKLNQLLRRLSFLRDYRCPYMYKCYLWCHDLEKQCPFSHNLSNFNTLPKFVCLFYFLKAFVPFMEGEQWFAMTKCRNESNEQCRFGLHISPEELINGFEMNIMATSRISSYLACYPAAKYTCITCRINIALDHRAPEMQEYGLIPGCNHLRCAQCIRWSRLLSNLSCEHGCQIVEAVYYKRYEPDFKNEFEKLRILDNLVPELKFELNKERSMKKLLDSRKELQSIYINHKLGKLPIGSTEYFASIRANLDNKFVRELAYSLVHDFKNRLLLPHVKFFVPAGGIFCLPSWLYNEQKNPVAEILKDLIKAQTKNQKRIVKKSNESLMFAWSPKCTVELVFPTFQVEGFDLHRQIETPNMDKRVKHIFYINKQNELCKCDLP